MDTQVRDFIVGSLVRVRNREWVVLPSDENVVNLRPLSGSEGGVVVDNLTFNLSHRSGEGEDVIPVHIEGLKIDLDKRLHTKLRTSPQAMVQEFLNHSESVLWGIVTNGLTLRLLRDSSRTSRPTYVEFDLESILEGNRFAEFALFYRLCHRSRFPRPGQDPSECILEKYYQQSIDEGSRVREGLRAGVEETLKIFGNAFLQHPANRALCEKLTSGRLNPVQYHRQLLLLVYRLLFLMVAEERRLIVSQGEGSERNQRIYDQWYSVSALRDRASRIIEESPFGDVWLGLLQTFSLFEYGVDSNPLSIPPLNGDLFNQDRAVPDLVQTQLYNHDLLRAVRHLSVFKADGLQQRVNYAALDVEELGSVYESLLAYQPVIEPGDTGLEFDLRTGSERKSTGSYYTRPELVHELIESALVPVMEDRIAQAEKTTEGKDLQVERNSKVKAILAMTVCDPACGSGHFLLAAARRLGKELARIKTGEDEPTPEEFHLAVREVIQHCIYGVDLNPLAVDLCKLAMWLEGHWAGKPLSFLDHRIRCGNSLVGVLDPAVLEDGIPDDAFTAVTGDEKKAAAYFKKRNKQDQTSRGFSFETENHENEYAKATRDLSEITEDTAAAVRRKTELYSNWRSGMNRYHDEAVADLWTAQFFVPLMRTDDPAVCTTKDFLEFSLDKLKKPQQVAAAQVLAVENRFFHWHLEFPEVFGLGGFDVVLGNPPWERLKLQEEEHWANDKYVSAAGTKAERTRRIEEYRRSIDPLRVARARRFDAAKHAAEAVSKFIRASGRLALTAVGDLNTYGLFAELSHILNNGAGRAGVIVQSGIATDDTYKDFFSSIVEKNALVSLFDFVNLEGFFPGIHRTHPHFCALTMSRQRITRPIEFSFFLTRTDQLRDANRRFTLGRDDLNLLNPNTRTCPVFRSRADAQLTRRIYSQFGILTDESRKLNPWGVSFLRMFDMSNDSALFLTEPLQDALPLYEAKLVHQYDHRWATYEGDDTRDFTLAEKMDTGTVITPHYWLEAPEVLSRVKNPCNWLLGFRSLTNTTNERTGIFGLIPFSAVGNSFIVLDDWKHSAEESACFLANGNSLVLDYVVRQKMGGTNFNFFIVNQLPFLGPEQYRDEDRSWIANRVLKLVYTAVDLKGYAYDLGYSGPCITWDVVERTQLRAEIDAYYAHLYRLTRDELRYIFDPKDVFGEDFPSESFRVLKEREIKEFGEYRTQRLVLEAFDKLAESPRFRDEMLTRVSAFEVPTETPKRRN